MRLDYDIIVFLIAVLEVVAVVDEAYLFFPRCTTDVFARNLNIAATAKLNIDFQEARVRLTACPVELHKDWRGTMIKRPCLFNGNL